MKKLALLLGLSSILSTSAFALECDNIYGTWQGTLSALNGVRLSIHPFDGMETANIAFVNDGENIEYGLFIGNCQKNADGSVTMHLTRNSYGVQGNIDMQLTNTNTLNVSSFTYRDFMDHGSGSGILSK